MEQTDASLVVGLMSNNQLVDFDWSIKGIFGTSSAIAYPPPPLVEVDFHLCSNSNFNESAGNVTETMKLEMNNQELKTLIVSLEKAMSNIQS